MTIARRAAALLAAALAWPGLAAATQPPARQPCQAVSRIACDAAHAMGPGVNLGNMLDAPREGDWGVKAEPRWVELAAKNFRTVRVPVRWSNHASPDASARIDEAFARRVDTVVDGLLARGAWVIVNVHHYSQLAGGELHRGEFAVDPKVAEARLVNLWRQIAARYRDRPPRLVFELLNEPTDTMDPQRWNALAARTLAAVRQTNPDRVVMIGPVSWNHPRGLASLRLPRDPYLIVPIHVYDPFPFTHQAVSWRSDLPAGVRCCDAAQRREVAQAFEQAERWSRAHGVPLHLGEFGAHSAGDLASRARWARLLREEAEKRGIGWAWWELASDFSGVWDPAAGRWVEPLRAALLEPLAKPIP